MHRKLLPPGPSCRSSSELGRRWPVPTALRKWRFDGAERAAPGETVSSVAAALGYVNLTAMTVSYRQRFGESPHQTLRSRPMSS